MSHGTDPYRPAFTARSKLPLVKASDLPPNTCRMSTYDIRGLIGEIDVLRSDEYANLPGCLDGVDIAKDQ
jgi:hypothetical protein